MQLKNAILLPKFHTTLSSVPCKLFKSTVPKGETIVQHETTTNNV